MKALIIFLSYYFEQTMNLGCLLNESKQNLNLTF